MGALVRNPGWGAGFFPRASSTPAVLVKCGLVEAALALPVAFMAIWLRNLPLYLTHEGMAKWPSGDA